MDACMAWGWRTMTSQAMTVCSMKLVHAAEAADDRSHIVEVSQWSSGRVKEREIRFAASASTSLSPTTWRQPYVKVAQAGSSVFAMVSDPRAPPLVRRGLAQSGTGEVGTGRTTVV